MIASVELGFAMDCRGYHLYQELDLEDAGARAIGQALRMILEKARTDRGPEKSEDPRRWLCIRLRTIVPQWLKR